MLRRAGVLALLAGALLALSLFLGNGLFVRYVSPAPNPVALPTASPTAAAATPTGPAVAVHLTTATRAAASATALSATATNLPPTEVPATSLPTTSSIPTITPTPSITATAVSQLPLQGRRIGLDPGNGPRGNLGVVLKDPLTGKLILSEAEFNLDVALRCREILRARGASVVLTRETADTFTAPWPVDANGDGIVGDSGDDLQERIDIVNNFHAEVFLSIHANGGGSASAGGPDLQVIYCGTPECSFPAQSKQLGQVVLDQLKNKLDAAGYTAKGGQLLTDLAADTSSPPQHLFLLGPANPPRHARSTNMPGVVAASLYVTSLTEAAELNKSSMRQAIALAYADALESYLTGSK